MHLLTKSYNLSASHCLKGHIKCGRMHGHNYQIDVVIGSELVNDQGMVIDFGNLKKILNEILSPYDHRHLGTIPDGWQANKEHVISLPFEHTTAENLAEYWGKKIQDKIKPLKLIELSVHETPSSKATWIPT